MYHCWLIRLNRVNVWKCNESFVCNDCANSKGRMAGMKWWWKRLPTDQTWWTHGHILEIRNTQSPRSTSRAKWEEVPLLWGGPSGSSLKDCPDFLLYFLLRFKLVFHGFHKYFSRRRRNLPIFWFFFFCFVFHPQLNLQNRFNRCPAWWRFIYRWSLPNSTWNDMTFGIKSNPPLP